jgi:hypothetical protein
MRGKKLAFIYTDYKPGEYYFGLHNGLFESFRHLNRNFEVMVFTYSDQMNVLRRPKYDVVFRNTDKSIEFAVNEYFNPTHTFFIGSSDFDFDRLKLDATTPKYLIHKGNKHDKRWYDYFENVIVETEEEKHHYKNSTVASVVNTKMYYPQMTDKYFTFCFPQDLSVGKLEFFSKVRVYGSISQTLNSTVKLPLDATSTLTTVINQSKAVSLIEDTNESFEIALSALACNVPVLATIDSKASKIPAVVKSLATTPEFTIAMLEALQLENKHNFRDEYIMPNYGPNQYAKLLMDIIV